MTCPDVVTHGSAEFRCWNEPEEVSAERTTRPRAVRREVVWIVQGQAQGLDWRGRFD